MGRKGRSSRRARASETRTEQSRPRAWLPLMLGVVLLVAQAASRRTAALVGLAFACLTVPHASAAQQPQLPRSPAEKAWDRHDLRRARVAYLAELAARRKERSEEHTSELQSRLHLVCRLLLEKKKT